MSDSEYSEPELDPIDALDEELAKYAPERKLHLEDRISLLEFDLDEEKPPSSPSSVLPLDSWPDKNKTSNKLGGTQLVGSLVLSKPLFEMPPMEERWLGYNGDAVAFWDHFHKNANIATLLKDFIPPRRLGALSLVSRDWNRTIQNQIMEPFYAGDPWRYRLSSVAHMGTEPKWLTPKAFEVLALARFPRSLFSSLPQNFYQFVLDRNTLFHVQKKGKKIWNKFLYGEPQFKEQPKVFNGRFPADEYRKPNKVEKSPRSLKRVAKRLTEDEKKMASELQSAAFMKENGTERRKRNRTNATAYANDLYILQVNDAAPIYLDYDNKEREYDSDQDQHCVFANNGAFIAEIDTNTLAKEFPLDSSRLDSMDWDNQFNSSYGSYQIYAGALKDAIGSTMVGHAQSLQLKSETVKRKIALQEKAMIEENLPKKPKSEPVV